jgi:hypothetical protein
MCFQNNIIGSSTDAKTVINQYMIHIKSTIYPLRTCSLSHISKVFLLNSLSQMDKIRYRQKGREGSFGVISYMEF